MSPISEKTSPAPTDTATAADEPDQKPSTATVPEPTATLSMFDKTIPDPTDTAFHPPEGNTTTAHAPEPQAQQSEPDNDLLPMTTAAAITTVEPLSHQSQRSEQIDVSTAPLPITTTASIPTPAAPPAEEIPSSKAFVSPSPALPPLSRSSTSRQPRSRTPSSTRTSSRPLSQVFDRLRDISRSSTRSKRDKGSRSRPASLVLGNPDLLEDSNQDTALWNVETKDSRPVPTRSTSSFSIMNIRSTERRVDSWEEPRPAPTRVMSMASPTRTEAWNEPDAQLPPPKTPEERSGTPRRLGILPSPAPTAGTFEEGERRRASAEVGRRRSSAVGWRPVTSDGEGMGGELGTVESEGEISGVGRDEDKEEEILREVERPTPIRKSSDLAVLPSQRGEEEEHVKEEERPTPIRKGSDLAILPSQRSTREEEISPSPTFPPQSPTQPPPQRPRKLSDLQLLPSQRRLSPLNIGRPDSMTLTTLNFSSNESVDAEAEVYEASPVTIKEMSPPVVVSGRKSGDDERTPVAGRGEEDELYESTPIASRMKEDGWDRKVSASTNADFEDARSEVSAEEGAQQESSHHSTNPTTSRHSSVSSLGARAAVEEQQPVMSAQAVPAGPVAASPHTTPERALHNAGVLQEITAAAARRHEQLQPQLQVQDAGEFPQRFANRQYREQRPGMGERPMSYMPLPRDAQGLPVQEIISTGGEEPAPSQPPAMPVDLSNMAGPPPGAPPFSLHPAVRNSGSVQPTQYERLRSSVISTGSGHTPQSSIDMGGRPPSGFFRGRPEQTGAAPPPSRISDTHGLEGLQYGQVGAEAASRQDDAKQGRRRSGLWESLTSRRSSAQRVDSSRESSVAPLEAPVAAPAPEVPATAEDTKRKTLKKPQRAESSSEPKKKRFSKLGSFFGRSSTTAGSSSAAKPNRLTKNAPPTRENSTAQTQSAAQQPQPQNSSTVVGSVRGYEAFEAMRRRDMPAFQENAANVQRPPSAHAQIPEENVEPPLGGWYGPQSEQQERPMSPTEAPRPEFRRLHSESRRGGERGGLAQVPEAFRPVQASFNRPIEPIGPPPGQEPPTMRMQYPGQTPSAAMERMMDPRQYPPQSPQHQRWPSYGSDTTPPPMSGHYAPGSRPYGSLPNISPVQSRTAYDRVNSIPEERSPAREYADQQTPWAITLPQGGSGQSSRHSSWTQGMSPPHQEFVPPPPPQYRPPPPPQGMVLTARENVGFYPPPPRGTPAPRPFSVPWEDEQPVRQGPYPPFQQTHQQQQGYGYPPRGPPRFYARQNSGEYGYPPQNRPPQQRRPSSGYSGRRDDPTVGEEELVMRGASYPGQEWMPSGLGRWD
ncbi:hypothetical protein PRZ48_013623 [Zasmidium cellare]|uniref:Uncharacterized protein n=1 Tax=Zasmidium cellare TaxID=395010 RepID=A0ABR0E240_ZASCE|nr:hypothetical protein PRZ48_013623 [Zasmidium cellare]